MEDYGGLWRIMEDYVGYGGFEGMRCSTLFKTPETLWLKEPVCRTTPHLKFPPVLDWAGRGLRDEAIGIGGGIEPDWWLTSRQALRFAQG